MPNGPSIGNSISYNVPCVRVGGSVRLGQRYGVMQKNQMFNDRRNVIVTVGDYLLRSADGCVDCCAY